MLALTTLINGCRETQALEDGVWFVGRGEMCRVRLDFPDVSERHAMLVVRNGTAVLKDLNSANGTYVNGEELQGEVALDGSMVVQIGESMLRVCEAEELPEQAAPAVREAPAARPAEPAPAPEPEPDRKSVV